MSYIEQQNLNLDPAHYLYDPGYQAGLDRSLKALTTLKKTIATKEANLAAYKKHIQSLEEQKIVTKL